VSALTKITPALVSTLLFASGLTEARLLYQRCDFAGALKALQPEGSKDPEVLALAGRSHYFLANYTDAIEFLELAVRIDPRNAGHHLWLGRAYGRRAENSSFFTAPGYAQKARRHFEVAVELDPTYLEALSDLMEYYMEAPGFLGGGMDKAAAVAEKIAKIDPAEGHNAQARLAERRRDYKIAEREFRRAAELEPGNVGRWIDLAKFLARRGRFRESDAVFERATEVAPESPKLLFARAESYLNSKRNQAEARSLLEKYLKLPLTPDDPPRRDAEKLLKQAGG
jgi:Flp pilus assembly protein TadD